MKQLLLLSIIILTACGPSPEEKKNIAAVTCSIMGESRNMDSAVRIEKMNDAREKIGGEPFLDSDEAIKESFEFGLCQELVLDDSYKEILQPLKDAKRERERLAEEKRAEEARIAAEERRIAAEKRIAEEKRAEEKRIAQEKRAEEKRIAAEKQRIADSKPTVKEEFYANGKLKSRTNFQPKSDGGEYHGAVEEYYENGQLEYKYNYKDGKLDGAVEEYYENGQLELKFNFKDGKEDGIHESYDETGQLRYTKNYKDGKSDGLRVSYLPNGKILFKTCYKNDEEVRMSYCKK